MEGLRRLSAIIVLIASIVGSAACGPGLPSPASLVQALPPSLARAALWQPGPGDAGSLAETFQVDGMLSRASIVTAAPAVRLVLHTEAASAVIPRFYRELADAPDGWRLFAREQVTEANVGVPALGIGPDLLVSGDLAEVREIADRVGVRLGDERGNLSADLVDGARLALVEGPPGRDLSGDDLAPLRSHAGYSLTWSGGDAGMLTLLMDQPTQQDAVQVAVRLRTAMIAEGQTMSSLLVADGPLATDDRVVTAVRWVGEPADLMRTSLQESLSTALAPSG